MAVPRRPHQPRAPRTTRASRISTHAATRAPQHTSLTVHALCQAPAHCFRHHALPERAAPGTTQLHRARRARRHAARAGHRARSPLPEQGCCAVCMQPAQQPCSEPFSPRAPHRAPAASRLHDADPALHEARAWHAARALRHPFSVLSSRPAHSAEHMQGTQGTCARRAVPAQRCSPHPATVACLT